MSDDLTDQPPSEEANVAFIPAPKQLRGGSYKTSTYYKEKHALRIKPAIDHLIKTGVDLQFSYAKFDMSAKTLEQFIRHSFCYLVDVMDNEEGDYARVYDMSQIRPESNGICIRLKKPKDSIMDGIEAAPEEQKEEVIGLKETEWMTGLKEFLSVAKEGETFEKANVKFSVEEVQWIHGLLGGMEGIHYRVGDRMNFLIVVKG